MHVALVGDHPFPGESGKGGVQRVAEVLRRELGKRVKVTLIVPSARRSLRHADEHGEIIYLQRPTVPGFLSYWSLVSRDVFRELVRLGPDIVHVQDVAGLALLWPSKSALHFPVVFTAHGVLEADILHVSGDDLLRRLTANARSAVVGAVERMSRRRYDDVIVINEYVLEAMPDVKRRRHHFIPNPVDKVFFDSPRPMPPPGQGHDILQIGVVSPRKNVIASIKIMGELVLRGAQAHLHVIGPATSDDYRRACLDEITRLTLEDSVTFHGNLTPSEIASWMDRASLLMLPSKQETAPMVVAEAHCRGLPVAGPRAFGLRSMVSEGTNGIFLDGADPADDARRVEEFLLCEVDRETIRRNAVLRYELGNVIERTIEVYSGALRARSTEPRRIAGAGT